VPIALLRPRDSARSKTFCARSPTSPPPCASNAGAAACARLRPAGSALSALRWLWARRCSMVGEGEGESGEARPRPIFC
jgi:hypothetical protein